MGVLPHKLIKTGVKSTKTKKGSQYLKEHHLVGYTGGDEGELGVLGCWLSPAADDSLTILSISGLCVFKLLETKHQDFRWLATQQSLNSLTENPSGFYMFCITVIL